MAGPSDDDRPRPPKFPRRRWQPGQVERAEELRKGAGYDRRREDREADEEIDEELDEGKQQQ
ncbi:MAG: hypothetical protein ISS74_01580 [Planctomycetes bacterium]|nr:hypothetical protein [Planctomycetota bacterium]